MMEQVKQNILLKDITTKELLQFGAEAFTQEIQTMVEKRIIAPYNEVVKRDQEILRLKRRIKELEAKIKKNEYARHPKNN